MPMMQWSAPAGGPHGTPIEIRVQETIYTFVDGQPLFCEPEHVGTVTTALNAAVPGGTITLPAGAQ